jgi:hypothetical protein
VYTRTSTLFSWVALWALGFVRASVRGRMGGCGSGSSLTGGLFFCGDKAPQQDTLNGSILNVASVIKNVVASAAESEVGACFHNAQSGAPLRVTLTELGHIQPPTPLRTDNSTAFGILNETIIQKRSKAMDM